MSTLLPKSQMTEEDIKLNYITPALLSRGWQNKITMETKVQFTDGKINLRGNLVAREAPKKADYILYIERNYPIAIVEAKDNHHSVSFGLQQAMVYAKMLDVPFAYSSNGKRIRDIMRNDAGINGDAQRIEQIAWMLFLKVYDAKEQDWEINDDDYESIIPEECRWINWAYDDRSGSAMTGDSLLNFVNNTLFPTLKGLEVTPETPIKKSIVKTTFEDANQYMKDGVLLRQVINIIDELDLSDYEESHAFGEIYESILRELQSAGSSGEFYTPRAVTDFMAKMIAPQIGERCAENCTTSLIRISAA